MEYLQSTSYVQVPPCLHVVMQNTVCRAACWDELLLSCLLFILVGWILLGSLPSQPTDVKISGVQSWSNWSSVYTGHNVYALNIFV